MLTHSDTGYHADNGYHADIRREAVSHGISPDCSYARAGDQMGLSGFVKVGNRAPEEGTLESESFLVRELVRMGFERDAGKLVSPRATSALNCSQVVNMPSPQTTFPRQVTR